VAVRIAKFAKTRQVIALTHELAFAGELAAAAEHESVPLTERRIELSGAGEPGVCLDGHPWKAKSVKRRLAELELDLKSIERDHVKWTTEEYERRVAHWAGGLSETWERILNEEIADYLVDPSKLEVRPRMVKVLARITETDTNEFDDSYSRISRWARRHDKDRGLNYVAPGVGDLRSEYELARGWFERIKKYRE
jgi:hypothetical protein